MCNRHLEIRPLSVPAMATERGGVRGGKKKLQHISGIFQLMMCGCGSTGEREPLTVLSLFHLPRAPCCIPVHCTYFGNICSAPFFSVLLYSLRAALARFPSAPRSSALSCSDGVFGIISSPPYRLSWPGRAALWGVVLSAEQEKEGK